MRRHGAWARWSSVAAAAALATASGCMNCLHPVAHVSADAAAQCAALPQDCRNHVYIFLINGPAPVDMANLNGVRDELISLGYIKTYCGESYHTGYFKDEIRRIHREDESARFVAIGSSLGANAARNLADAVQPDGVQLDLLAYCGGVALSSRPKNQPENALRVVHILGAGADAIGAPLDGAENVQLADASHYGSPTHPYTMDMLTKELMEVASRVPVIGLRPAAESGRPPQPAASRETMPRDDWDFLKSEKPSPQRVPVEPAPAMPKAP